MRSSSGTYVHRLPRSANLYYIRDVPADVRAKVGRSKWKQSLGTAVRAQALRAARRLAEEHDRLIQTLRTPVVSVLDTLDAAERARVALAGGTERYIAWMNARAEDAQRLQLDADFWRDLAGDEGSADEIPDPDWAEAKVAGIEAERRGIAAHISREGQIVDRLLEATPELRTKHPAIAEAVAVAPPNPNRMTMRAVFERWRDQKRPATPEQYAYPVQIFEDLHSSPSLSAITAEHVRDFRDELLSLPRCRAGGQGLRLPQLRARAARENWPAISASTAAKYLRCIQTLLKFAESEGYLDQASGLTIRIHGSRKASFAERRSGRRRTFSPAELRVLIAAAESRWKHEPENTWFLRLLLYTGARPEEVAQLAAGDVVEVRGITCLRIHDEGSNTVKNSASVRTVPIHPTLKASGLEQFIRSRRTAPYLFMSLAPDGRGRRYSRMQRRLTALMKSQSQLQDERLVPYSIRHTFKDAMRLSGAPEEVVERIMGHSSPDRSVARGYGNPDQITILAKYIDTIDLFDERRSVRE